MVREVIRCKTFDSTSVHTCWYDITLNDDNPLLIFKIAQQVHILVSDLDDNKPMFLKNVVTSGVRVDAALQTEVVRLEAEDKDPTSQPIRSFSLLYTHMNTQALFL